MSDGIFCAGCQRDGDNTIAESWCSDCGELVCNVCAKFHKKLSSPHTIVPIDQIQNPTSKLFVKSRICEYHPDQKIVLFCSQHDCVLCDSCRSELHQSCKSIISIEKAAKGVKSGVAFFDIEKRMENICEVIEKNLRDQIRYKEEFHISRKDIKTKISELKTKGIAHLHQLEETLIKNLDKQYIEHENTFIEGESHLQSMLESVSSSLTDFKSLKPHATEILLFQAVKYLDAETCKHEFEVRKLQNSSLPKFQFQTQNHFMNLSNSFPSLGTVTIEKEPMQVSAGLDTDQQGQSHSRSKSDQKKLCLFTSFNTTNFTTDRIKEGCFIPDNRVLLVSSFYQKLYVCELDGSNSRSVDLDFNPFTVTLYENNKALVSSNRRFVQIVDLDSLEPISDIMIGMECSAITSINRDICVRDSNCSLSLVDIDGEEQGKISTTSDPLHLSITKDNEIYYIASNDDKVFVTTLYENERVFYDNPDLQNLTGIAVDDNKNVYVSSATSNAIYRISRDGQKHEVVLNEEDGIDYPCGLSYYDLTKEVMVFNDNGGLIQIYKIIQ